MLQRIVVLSEIGSGNKRTFRRLSLRLAILFPHYKKIRCIEPIRNLVTYSQLCIDMSLYNFLSKGYNWFLDKAIASQPQILAELSSKMQRSDDVIISLAESRSHVVLTSCDLFLSWNVLSCFFGALLKDTVSELCLIVIYQSTGNNPMSNHQQAQRCFIDK